MPSPIISQYTIHVELDVDYSFHGVVRWGRLRIRIDCRSHGDIEDRGRRRCRWQGPQPQPYSLLFDVDTPRRMEILVFGNMHEVLIMDGSILCREIERYCVDYQGMRLIWGRIRLGVIAADVHCSDVCCSVWEFSCSCLMS